MIELNADFSKPTAVRTAAMQWQSSPGAGVWRKRLELRGAAESGRVTAIVRYDPGSRHQPFSDEGCTLYVKTGHLRDL